MREPRPSRSRDVAGKPAARRSPEDGDRSNSLGENQPGLLIALPWPPSINHYYRHIVVKGHVRVVISAEGRRYAQEVGVFLAGLRHKVPSPPHEVRVALHAPTRARIDLDNRMKGLLDAIYHALDLDDSVIDRLVIDRAAVVAGGRALVLIKAFEPPPAPLGGEDGEGE